MAIAAEFLDAVALAARQFPGPRVMLCPRRDDRTGMKPFDSFIEWQRFVLEFSLSPGIPHIIRTKFERVQKQYIIAWLDLELMLTGETAALTTLELALKDRYGHKVRNARGEIYFSRLVEYMVEIDGLTDDQIPLARKFSAPIVANLYETRDAYRNRKGTMVAPPMTLVETRNQQMHGYPDRLPRAGLLELCRDLIEYAYRHMINEFNLHMMQRTAS